MRRSDICLYLGPADRAGLPALITNRNTRRKLVWRSGIMLVTADGQGRFGIMRRARMSKPTVRHRRERYADEGMAGLKRDRTRPSRVPPLPMETRLKVIAKAVQETPPKAMQGEWQGPRAFRRRASAGYGRKLACSRIARQGSRS